MKKQITCLVLALLLFLTGCAPAAQEQSKQYTATFLDLFDTVTTVVGVTEDKATFEAQAAAIRDALKRYHQLFDIYHEYDGIQNLKTVNDRAGQSPVQVDPEIIRLLKDCKEYYTLTGGRVNVAMGSVLQLWHEARNNSINAPSSAYLPDMQELQEAAKHTGMDAVIIDEAASTVYISDPLTRLDVGAIAKGWAAQQVAKTAPSGYLLSVGGNVCATGPKKADGTPWVIGVTDPKDPSKNIHTIYVTGGNVVTSGDYQRSFTVNGKAYHHIIDPDTLMPSEYWSSVTVVCEDSGLADALSTALFLLPLEEGKALVEKLSAQALWIDAAGNEHMTPGFQANLRT